MMSRQCCLLLALALSTAEALLERRSGVQVQRRSASCSCECCSVAKRRSDEGSAGANVKCAPADGHSSEMCTDQCTPTPGDKVLGLVAEDQVLDYSRFCFHECKPADGVESLTSTQCLALDEEEAAQVVDAQGNPMDPAFLYAKAPEEAKKQRARADEAAMAMLLRTGEPGDPEEVDLEDAHATALDGRAAAKDAVDQGGKTLGKLSEGAPANDIPDIRLSEDPLLLAAKTQDHALRAEDLAHKAEHDAEASIEALKAGRNETWMAAMWTANKRINFLRRTDHRLATMHVKAPKPWRALSAYASRAAAAPYVQAAQYWEQTAPSLQREAAKEAMRQGEKLREQAEALDAEGDILKRKGLVAEAEIKAKQADYMTDKLAKEQDDKAEDFLEAAQQDKKMARETGYMSDANLAASQAVAKLELPVRWQHSHPPDPLLHWHPSAPDPNP